MQPQRRRVSIQGEKVATRAVDKLTAGASGNNNSDNSSVGGNSRSGVGGDGSVQDEHDIHQSYYRFTILHSICCVILGCLANHCMFVWTFLCRSFHMLCSRMCFLFLFCAALNLHYVSHYTGASPLTISPL